MRLYFGRLWKTWQERQAIADASLIICQGIFDPGSLLVGAIAGARGVPYCVLPRGDFVPVAANWRITRNSAVKWFIWRVLGVRHVNRADYTVVTSRLEGVRLVRAGADPMKIRVIPDPVYREVVQMKSTAGNRDRTSTGQVRGPYVLWLGRIAREKGLVFLLDVWRTVVREMPGRTLVIAGSIYDRAELKRLIDRIRVLGLEKHVEIISWIDGEEKNAMITNARCLVLPSHYESFGLVVVEAISHGTPVVVSNETPWEALVPPVGSCVSFSVSEWVAALRPYLTANQKTKLSDACIRDILMRFTEPAVTETWERLWKEWTRQLANAGRAV
ncbi:MAG: glycosyltransferase [Ktedonobacteraceae bacterium]